MSNLQIVITGGPGAGKTTLIQKLIKDLEKEIVVFSPPEISTMLYQANIRYSKIPKENKLELNNIMFQIYQAQQTHFNSLAKLRPEKSIVVYDRAACDMIPHIGEEKFQLILEKNHISRENIYSQFNGVIHLETAATLGEDYYNNHNNQARKENYQEACQIDKLMIKAWSNHPDHRVIKANPDIEEKYQSLLKTVNSII